MRLLWTADFQWFNQPISLIYSTILIFVKLKKKTKIPFISSVFVISFFAYHYLHKLYIHPYSIDSYTLENYSLIRGPVGHLYIFYYIYHKYLSNYRIQRAFYLIMDIFPYIKDAFKNKCKHIYFIYTHHEWLLYTADLTEIVSSHFSFHHVQYLLLYYIYLLFTTTTLF